MTWIKLDDGFFTSEKALLCSDAALLLYLRAKCWSSNKLQDGRVPFAVVRAYGSDEIAAELIEVGLFRSHKRGYTIVDYAKEQRTKAEIVSERAEARDRMRKVRSQRVRPNKGVTDPNIANVRPPESERETYNPPTPQGGLRPAPPMISTCKVCGRLQPFDCDCPDLRAVEAS